MHAEIIAIGDEIVSGQHLDTNSAWLSQRLEELGVRTLYHSTVGGELEPCIDVFRRAIERADIVISTGGLGPTEDDLTREALARTVGRDLILYPEALEHIRGLFARRKREMPKRNEIQAMFPQNSRMIPNPHGTAPGIDLEVPRSGKNPCRFFALPGVPSEMFEMWDATLKGDIYAMSGGLRIIRRRKINCFGAGESQIEAMLPDLIHRGHVPTVGITASKTTISLRITAEGTTEEECKALIDPTAATIYQCLGKLIFGEGDDELQHVVIDLLKKHNKTLATVEFGTAGLVADWLGEIPHGGTCFLGGLVVQSPNIVAEMLGVERDSLPKGQIHREADVKKMAIACRAKFSADFGLAVGGFPKYDENNPTPVYLALAHAGGMIAKSIPFAGHPAWIKLYVAKHALNILRLAMQL